MSLRAYAGGFELYVPVEYKPRGTFVHDNVASPVSYKSRLYSLLTIIARRNKTCEPLQSADA